MCDVLASSGCPLGTDGCRLGRCRVGRCRRALLSCLWLGCGALPARADAGLLESSTGIFSDAVENGGPSNVVYCGGPGQAHSASRAPARRSGGAATRPTMHRAASPMTRALEL